MIEQSSMANDQPLPILVLVKDLLFSTKITATAKAENVACKLLRDPAKIADEPGQLLIVDLNQPEVIPAAANWRAQGNRTVIGFVSHVDKETITAAKSAGIDRVMPRSQFVESLPTLMAKPT